MSRQKTIKKSPRKKESKWTYYLLELLVVFVGVTAGFLLNTWRQEKSDKELEQKYISGFYADAQMDNRELDSLLIRGQQKVDSMLKIFRKSVVQNLPLNEQQANKIVKEMLYIEWFSPADDTYEGIKNSGNFNMISDYNLKAKIGSYYRFLKEVKNVEEFYQNHIDDHALPYLYKHYHLYKLKFKDKNSYWNLEFTNIYLGVIALLQENNSTYSEALAKNRELLKYLKKTLDTY